MEKRLSMFFACLFLSIGMALAQTKVTGTVVSSEDNEPVIGASVKVVGTKTGVATDIDGKFSLVVNSKNAELEFSSIGMVTKRLKASANMMVVLDPDSHVLEQVVVTGYGQAKKVGAVVGAIGTVGSDKLGKIVTPNFTDALAGLFLVQPVTLRPQLQSVCVVLTSCRPATSPSSFWMVHLSALHSSAPSTLRILPISPCSRMLPLLLSMVRVLPTV